MLAHYYYYFKDIAPSSALRLITWFSVTLVVWVSPSLRHQGRMCDFRFVDDLLWCHSCSLEVNRCPCELTKSFLDWRCWYVAVGCCGIFTACVWLRSHTRSSLSHWIDALSFFQRQLTWPFPFLTALHKRQWWYEWTGSVWIYYLTLQSLVI